MVKIEYKEITPEEYYKAKEKLGDIKFLFSGYKKELIIPDGLGLFGTCKYNEENYNSKDDSKFEFKKEISRKFERTLYVGEELHKQLNKVINEKKNL